jgi:hypothetical protein
MLAIEGSLSPCRSAVTAPMLRPHREINEVPSCARRYSITHYRNPHGDVATRKKNDKIFEADNILM